LCLLLQGVPAAGAPGDIAGKYPVNDNDPKASLPSLEERNKEPIEFAHHLQDLIARAEGAFRKRDYERSAKFYEALAIAVPDRAIAFSRLCVAYGRLGHVDLAAAHCNKALGLGGAKVIDHVRFINFTLQKDQFADADAKAIEASLLHLREHLAKNPELAKAASKEEEHPSASNEAGKGQASEAAPVKRSREELTRAFMEHRAERVLKEKRALQGEVADERRAVEVNPMHLPTEIEVLTCKLAARLQDAARLASCTNALSSLGAKEALVFPFVWSKALIEKDAEQAETLLEQAHKLGLGDATLAAMSREHEKAFASQRQLKGMLLGLAVLLGLAAIAWASRYFVRQRKPRVALQT